MMSKRSMLINFIVIVLSMSLASALTSLVLPICKDLARADRASVCYDSCISALGSDPRSNTATPPQLAQISFELSISKAKAILVTIHKRLKLRAPDPHDRQAALKKCFAVYSSVPGDLCSGLKALKSGNFITASARVSATMIAADTCRHLIKQKRGKTSPLIQEIIDFQHLGAISLGFTKLLRIIN